MESYLNPGGERPRLALDEIAARTTVPMGAISMGHPLEGLNGLEKGQRPGGGLLRPIDQEVTPASTAPTFEQQAPEAVAPPVVDSAPIAPVTPLFRAS
ncbi:MAG: hypothetical protein ABWX94_03215 [Candidatus Saccharimonadales bacterium]